MLGLTNLCFSL